MPFFKEKLWNIASGFDYRWTKRLILITSQEKWLCFIKTELAVHPEGLHLFVVVQLFVHRHSRLVHEVSMFAEWVESFMPWFKMEQQVVWESNLKIEFCWKSCIVCSGILAMTVPIDFTMSLMCKLLFKF